MATSNGHIPDMVATSHMWPFTLIKISSPVTPATLQVLESHMRLVGLDIIRECSIEHAILDISCVP